MGETGTTAPELIRVDFEVFGKVQGVSFRIFTKRQARTLGLGGWVQNTSRNTVIGSINGDVEKVNAMKQWLQNTGSPASRIDKVEFTNEERTVTITQTEFKIV